MKEEIKKETEQKRINEAKDRKDPEPVIIPEEQKNRNNEMKIVRQINEVLKFRDPILEKMTYEIWLTIPQNKRLLNLMSITPNCFMSKIWIVLIRFKRPEEQVAVVCGKEGYDGSSQVLLDA